MIHYRSSFFWGAFPLLFWSLPFSSSLPPRQRTPWLRGSACLRCLPTNGTRTKGVCWWYSSVRDVYALVYDSAYKPISYKLNIFILSTCILLFYWYVSPIWCIYIYILICCVCDEIVVHLFIAMLNLKLKLQNPDPYKSTQPSPLQSFPKFCPRQLRF